MGNELVDLELAIQVVVDQVRQLGPTFHATKGTALPDATSDELERCRRKLVQHCAHIPVDNERGN